jgi:single-stranded-DNA-specific exonuclease
MVSFAPSQVQEKACFPFFGFSDFPCCASLFFEKKDPMTQIFTRPIPEAPRIALEKAGISPLFARLYASRGIKDPHEIEYTSARLLSPFGLLGIDRAAFLLADAIQNQKRLLIVGDYDCDGATATAVGLRGLRLFGACVDYLVPNRFEYGYGLSPAIVDLAVKTKAPDVIITVDNGIASLEGVQRAHEQGLTCIITDHHLPGDALPDAQAIVNPNQPGCPFQSKALAGVGVMFYVLLALRAELRARGVFAQQPEPALAPLFDLVALGTVADVVALDHNNRILVAQGLLRIRQGQMQPGVAALMAVAGRNPAEATSADFGFGLGPRINAAGRLADMSLGIECLITDDPEKARKAATELDALNRERRAIEGQMQLEALEQIPLPKEGEDQASFCVFDPDWHEGVIGIVAGRLKERLHRPVIAFAQTAEGSLKGSGRSIEGLHLRDALDWVSKRHPDIILRFGGHAMAAGLTLREGAFEAFSAAFESVVQAWLDPALRQRRLQTDGSLEAHLITLELAAEFGRAVWGQAFAAPLFCDEFVLLEQTVLKGQHSRLKLQKEGRVFEAMRFQFTEPLPSLLRVVYRPEKDVYRGVARLRLFIEHIEAV